MSCQSNTSDINQTFIIEPLLVTGATTPTFTACTGVYTNEIISCSGDSQILMSSGGTFFNSSIIPQLDDTIDLGTTFTRFRNINTVSGSTTVWSASTSMSTPILNLGMDTGGNARIITADSSVMQDDTLLGGVY
jgi:hypothetical protein